MAISDFHVRAQSRRVGVSVLGALPIVLLLGALTTDFAFWLSSHHG